MGESRWNGKAGWDMAESLDTVMQENLKYEAKHARWDLIRLFH